MHKVHYHYKMPYTDSNYGNIFSFWDHLLGTFIKIKSYQNNLRLDTFFNKKDNESIKSSLYRPFEKSKLTIDK